MIKAKDNYTVLNGELIKILPDEEDKKFLEFVNPHAMEDIMKLDNQLAETSVQLDFLKVETPFYFQLLVYIAFYIMLAYLFINII